MFYRGELLENHRYWQNPSNFAEQLTWILKGSAMLTGGYGHVTANTCSPIFCHVILVCRMSLFFVGFFFLVCLLVFSGTGTVWATLSWEYSDVMFSLNIILLEVGFILFCFIYFSWDASRPGELLKNRAVPAASQISSKSSKASELIQQNSGGSQCRLHNRILL